MKLQQWVSRAAALALAAWSLSVSAAGEVSLLKAQTAFHFSRQADYVGRFEAVVSNLGYQKNVSVSIKQKDGQWKDFPLSYNRPADANKEIWTASYYGLPTDAETLEFALKYQVNGQTYWDNNASANYRIAKLAGTVLYGPVVYNGNFEPTATVYASGPYYGSVTVKNLGYGKNVQVVYSTDNWATSKTVDASFQSDHWSGLPITNPNAYGFEEWTYRLNLDPTATQLDYAIRYTVNGQTYWDNNFGRNYRTVLIR